MRRIMMAVVASLIALAGLGFPTGAGERSKVSTPFNGKDLSGWKLKGDAKRSKWQVGLAELNASNPAQLQLAPIASDNKGLQMVNTANGGVDIYSEEKWGDATIEVELMVPKGSNSGIYVMGEYEVQVLDSWGREKVGAGDIGGLYGAAAPRANASKKPGEWQKFVIDFQAPKFEDGKKVSNAKFLKVVLNDQVIHENVEMKGPTPSGVTGKEAPTGPLMFQGDHGPVAFRNIRIVAK
jgi:hypothetical protein